MEQEMRTLRCLHCGKEIHVPGELTSFACVYCGEKLDIRSYSPVQSADAEADERFAREHLLDCIRNFPNYYRNFGRKTYDSSFQTYVYGIEDAFRAMDRCICIRPTEREALIDSFVEEFLTQWDAFHRQGKSARSKAAVSRAMFNNKLTLAWYTVPAILYLDLSVGPDFTGRLERRFSEKYPDNVFHVGTYSEISNGFRKRGLCLITTAVCSSEGKPDNCPELTAFRAFRDGWLSQSEGGKDLIEAYYEIAPAIVKGIELCDDPEACCCAIRQTYLAPCYDAILANEPEHCRETYIRMVKALSERYGLSAVTK